MPAARPTGGVWGRVKDDDICQGDRQAALERTKHGVSSREPVERHRDKADPREGGYNIQLSTEESVVQHKEEENSRQH